MVMVYDSFYVRIVLVFVVVVAIHAVVVVVVVSWVRKEACLL